MLSHVLAEQGARVLVAVEGRVVAKHHAPRKIVLRDLERAKHEV